MRGFSYSASTEFTRLIVNTLQLAKYQHRKVKTYSGGNKRKLCVGIALVGSPQVLILDEPSSSVDPLSRRMMWNFIKSIGRLQKKSTILTTHSMEEVEALCDRIGIMISGELKCIGTSQHLKDKFVKGYRIVLTVKEVPNLHVVKESIKNYLNEQVSVRLNDFIKQRGIVNNEITIQCIEDYNTNMKFAIHWKYDHQNGKHEQLPLGYIFNLVENIKKGGDITEYSICQSTLEQVFLHLVQQSQYMQQPTSHVYGARTQPAAVGLQQQGVQQQQFMTYHQGQPSMVQMAQV